VTVRRTVLLAAGLTALVIGLLVVWLIRSNKPAAVLAALPAARAADVSTIDERIVKASDALVLPTSPPAPHPQPNPAFVADNAVEPFVPDPPAVQQQPPSLAGQPAFERQHKADTLASARRQVAVEARNADLAVKLDSVPATSTNRISPAGATVGADSAPAGEYVLQRGTVIPAATYTSIDSTVPGIVTAQVRQDVYDSTHRYLLVPKGSRLVGAYASGMTNGQARLFVGFDSIKLPNGHTIELGNMPGVDLQGVAGLGGKVDFHTARLFGNVVLLSILDAAIQLVQPRGSGNGTNVILNAGQVTGQRASTLSSLSANQNSNQTPTMHTPEGFILNVMVERDLSLSPYQAPSAL
jgi:type IV secretory pathway VirB10-like protein